MLEGEYRVPILPLTQLPLVLTSYVTLDLKCVCACAYPCTHAQCERPLRYLLIGPYVAHHTHSTGHRMASDHGKSRQGATLKLKLQSWSYGGNNQLSGELRVSCELSAT